MVFLAPPVGNNYRRRQRVRWMPISQMNWSTQFNIGGSFEQSRIINDTVRGINKQPIKRNGFLLRRSLGMGLIKNVRGKMGKILAELIWIWGASLSPEKPEGLGNFLREWSSFWEYYSRPPANEIVMNYFHYSLSVRNFSVS